MASKIVSIGEHRLSERTVFIASFPEKKSGNQSETSSSDDDSEDEIDCDRFGGK